MYCKYTKMTLILLIFKKFALLLRGPVFSWPMNGGLESLSGQELMLPNVSSSRYDRNHNYF